MPRPNETGSVFLLTESESGWAFRFESTSLPLAEHWVLKQRAESGLICQDETLLLYGKKLGCIKRLVAEWKFIN